MRESWTDERLDDGFDRVTTDISSLREEVGSLGKELHGEVGYLRQEVKSDLDSFRLETNARFDGLQRTLLQVGSGVTVALIGVIATQL